MLLDVRQAFKAYGAQPVIQGLDLAVRAGEFVGVIGPNGAGKSTAFGLIAGHLRCDAGSVWFDGADVSREAPDARCRRGIGRTFQIPQPFLGLSVYENVLVASHYGASLHGRAAQAAAMDALALCGLAPLADAPAATLTLLQRKRLELARALATGPRLLLLDEVGGGLTDAEVHQLMALVQQIHATGVTIVWIEHIVHALVAVASRLVVLTEGRILVDGPPREVIDSRLVRETYLGAGLAADTQEAAHA